MSLLIKAENLNLIKQGNHILKNINVTINDKDFITIIGPNGAGKSMLLKCLMGLEPIDEGVIIHKTDLKIGYVPQRLIPDKTMPLTVKKFLTLRKRINKAILEKTTMETNVTPILSKQLSVLSGGELQRVLLARSLLHDPDILILDEPAQNLDISGQLSFYKLIERIYEERGLSILMVSHDLHMVMASTRQVICLFHHICCSGEPRTITKNPEFISLFGDDMADMMAVYQHNHQE
jgi:zinc transport system ATP-binding protein